MNNTKYFTVNGEHFKVEFPCTIEDGKTWVDVYFFSGSKFYYHSEHHLKTYYRHERTWDDHLGNTPCGYYVNVPLPYGCGTKRVYVF